MIRVTKIRTMRDSPARTAKQVAERLAGLQTEEGRVTKIGSILRATGLDELPQLINVVRGEMQWIGLRPLPREEYDLLPPDIKTIYNAHLSGLFDVTLAPSRPRGTLEDKFDRMRASEPILKNLTTLKEEGESGKRAALMVRLTCLIYMRKLAESVCAKTIRDRLESILLLKKSN